jgi:hypothetical protein
MWPGQKERDPNKIKLSFEVGISFDGELDFLFFEKT